MDDDGQHEDDHQKYRKLIEGVVVKEGSCKSPDAFLFPVSFDLFNALTFWIAFLEGGSFG